MTTMKTYKNILLASLFGVALVGCNDLDTEPLAGFVTSEQKEEVANSNPDILEASVNAVMTMFSVYQNALGSSYHNDYGYPSVMLFTDSRGRDLVGTDIGYNWYGNQVTYEDQGSTYILPNYIWATMYNQLYTANNLLSTISMDGSDPEDDKLMYYYAQGLAVRAFDFFILAQMYQYNYVGHESSPCIVLVLDTNSDELAAQGGGSRATVQETYDQILSDLTRAIDLLERSSVSRPSGRTGKAFVDAAVAHGLRARVYLTMHDYASAVADAQAAINATDATPYSREEVSYPTFVTSDEHSWMWAVNIEETDDVVLSGIVNFASHMGSLNYGYASVGAWRACSKVLFDHIPDTDVRKGWWLNADGYSPNLDAEQAEYIASAGVDDYTQVKFGPYEGEIYTSLNANDVPLMRIEELYLILAEAQAMSGNPSGGAQTLQNFVQTYRDPAFTCSGSSAENVQKAVLFQRRVELWGEGFSWYDLMRLNKGVDRRGAGFQVAYVFNIDPNDPMLILQIPSLETNSNSNIGAQNAAGTEPVAVEDVITSEMEDEYNW